MPLVGFLYGHLCNHYHHLICESLITSKTKNKKTPCPWKVTPCSSLISLWYHYPLQVSRNILHRQNHWHMAYCLWLLLLSKTFSLIFRLYQYFIHLEWMWHFVNIFFSFWKCRSFSHLDYYAKCYYEHMGTRFSMKMNIEYESRIPGSFDYVEGLTLALFWFWLWDKVSLCSLSWPGTYLGV